MKELIFSIKNIFDSKTHEGALAQYNCTCYLIPAYQRGYKWGSDTNGAVSVLLDDLCEAYRASKNEERKEYYLQYITVKRVEAVVKNSKTDCMEVIDGQQRLTTLSILLSAISAVMSSEPEKEEKNIAKDKLDYASRGDFFSEHVYENDKLMALVRYKYWDDFVEACPDLDKQDIFYLFRAAIKCYEKVDNLKGDLEGFKNYLYDNVKLIVNSVESHVESEIVFRNLNSNKVLLTEAELVKGWLITKVGRNTAKFDARRFREIMEIRVNIGRHWDEMSRWAKSPEIETFFFDGKEGMHELLDLNALYLGKKKEEPDKKSDGKDYPLFNFYHKYPNVKAAYDSLKKIKNLLDDWFINDDVYNLIGFSRFAAKSKRNKLKFLQDCIFCEDKDALKKFLNKKITAILPGEKVEDLKYGERNDHIRAVLLFLSVFAEGLHRRFDFHEFVTNEWTLEHIFPQSPEGGNNILNERQKGYVLEMLGDTADEDVKKSMEKDERSPEEKEHYYNLLKSSPCLNFIGNMCLLTRRENSSIGCLFFNEKRKKILQRIQKGSFVPKHTFDVFSKMINTLEGDDLSTWTRKDIENHARFIEESLSKTGWQK